MSLKPNYKSHQMNQFSTFHLADREYGINVLDVQEVTKPLTITPIRRAPTHVIGLINLRGQIATAVGLRELFGLESTPNEKMSVVCKVDDALLCLLVDRIGDVVAVSDEQFEMTPTTLPEPVRSFMKGVYKTHNSILSVIAILEVSHFLNR